MASSIRSRCATEVSPCVLLLLLLSQFPLGGQAQVTRTDWEWSGVTPVLVWTNDAGNTCNKASASVNNPCILDESMFSIPADSTPGTLNDNGWTTARGPIVAPLLDSDGEIHQSGGSRLCSGFPTTCFTVADYNYYQTYVTIVAGTTSTSVVIAFTGSMDDLARVGVFTQSGMCAVGCFSTVITAGTGVSSPDISSLVNAGEVNRIVIIQADSCCSGNIMTGVQIQVGGVALIVAATTPTSVPPPPPTTVPPPPPTTMDPDTTMSSKKSTKKSTKKSKKHKKGKKGSASGSASEMSAKQAVPLTSQQREESSGTNTKAIAASVGAAVGCLAGIAGMLALRRYRKRLGYIPVAN